MPLPDNSVMCPATGFARSCRSIVSEHTCPKYVTLAGMHPQTGEVVNREGCVDSFLPLLLVENAQQTRQAGAAIETFRNEVVRSHQEAQRAAERTLRTLTGGAEPTKVIDQH